MPKYVIVREIPGAGSLTAEQLKGISQTSCGVLRNPGSEIQWVQFTLPKIISIVFTSHETLIRE